ncbi:MAG: DUF1501 domain-containing protein [Pirellulaceae bacterium]|nr:DUF1501 domain-containing protein [Pirellulaceae bacterium]
MSSMRTSPGRRTGPTPTGPAPTGPAPGTTRRELLCIGGLSLLGLSLPQLAALRAAAGAEARARGSRSCVLLFLFGGPSQIDLWDMKPSAPVEVRGEFRPIATRVPGIQVCEHLPRLAEQMDKLCLVRSMTHGMNVHGPACSEIFSGREYFGAPTTDQATEQDWPSLSAMTMRYGRWSDGLPPSVVLPWYLQFPGQARRIAGQTGGRMGEQHNALLIQGDSARQAFQVDGFHLREAVPVERLDARRRLLRHLQAGRSSAAIATADAEQYERYRQQAWSLLERQTGTLLDLDREPAAVRERYGPSMVGQSLLMARRLVEAGVSLVTVNWEDETKIDGVNTCWDTHQENFPKLKNLLCPIFDQAFPAFIEDLHERGLLESTLVVAVGEFGRTPYLGQFSQSSNTRKTGRDHWPSAFTALLAGGGVRGGQVYGATDHHAAQVADQPVRPSDLSATILHHLGIDPAQSYTGELQQLRYRLSDGKPITALG